MNVPKDLKVPKPLPGLVHVKFDGTLIVQGGVWPNGLKIIDERERK
jgi:hypothetical protein